MNVHSTLFSNDDYTARAWNSESNLEYFQLHCNLKHKPWDAEKSDNVVGELTRDQRPRSGVGVKYTETSIRVNSSNGNPKP